VGLAINAASLAVLLVGALMTAGYAKANFRQHMVVIGPMAAALGDGALVLTILALVLLNIVIWLVIIAVGVALLIGIVWALILAASQASS
jgi:hypothetical protein